MRFHLLAIAFLVFDVELLFLYPWSIANKGFGGTSIGQLVFLEIVLFMILLAAGFAYAWRKGVFRWR